MNSAECHGPGEGHSVRRVFAFLLATRRCPTQSSTAQLDCKFQGCLASVRCGRSTVFILLLHIRLSHFVLNFSVSHDENLASLSGYVRHGFEEANELDLGTGKKKSYVTPTLRKDEESPLYACTSYTVEPESLGRACRAVEEAGRGVHVIWADFEEFVCVVLLSFSFMADSGVTGYF
ncbi:hypothetical protein EDD22DRAFT_579808 [Suillus occidentalis]|nr:hypothetical protein EDD22DRAFT_579808 [Suillus occidentalis]